jgi:hypothetical protein
VEDRCPYEKPFPPGFDDCPAFRPVQFQPRNLHEEPLPPVLTCRHLGAGWSSESDSFYPRCALGDAEARRRWAAEHPAGRRKAAPAQN